MFVFLVAASSPALSVVRSSLSVALIVQVVRSFACGDLVQVIEIVEVINLAHSDNSPV